MNVLAKLPVLEEEEEGAPFTVAGWAVCAAILGAGDGLTVAEGRLCPPWAIPPLRTPASGPVGCFPGEGRLWVCRSCAAVRLDSPWCPIVDERYCPLALAWAYDPLRIAASGL